MAEPSTEVTPEFQRGWDAALVAARNWHEVAGAEDVNSGET